jgi:kinesin family member 5
MDENIKVVIRIKPKDDCEELKMDINNKSIKIGSYQGVFNQIFDGKSTQIEIYEKVAYDSILWVTQGYNTSIFAYGATSSGKSFTMFGDQKNPGIIPRCCEGLFKIINENENVVEANMKCSFIEIYRETIKDLLDDSGNSLKIRQNADEVYIQGVIKKIVCSPEEIMNTINNGVIQRTVCSTSLNNVSSRSHAVLTLTLTQKLSDGREIISKLNLVDLAGSENVNRSEAQGLNLIEAQTINKSLSCLGNVIYALSEKGRNHIPYRDSKLTYLLQDSLGGNARTIIIATINSRADCYSESLNTLKFAGRAIQIKNIPKINVNESQTVLLQRIEKLEKELEEMSRKYEDSQKIIDAVEKVNSPSKETVVYQTRCERLEIRIGFIEEQIKKEQERIKNILDLYHKQRKLAQKIARKLYKEKLNTCGLKNELEQYTLLYNSMKECEDNPNVLQAVFNRGKIIPNTKYEIESVDSDIDEV